MTLVSKNGRPSRVTSLFSCQGVVPTWRIRLCWCVLRSSLPLSSIFFVLLFFWVASCGGSGGNVAHNGASSALIANAWIPSGFLANYTFNSAVGVGECYANPSLTPTDASATSTGLTTSSMCGESTSSHQCLYLRGDAAAECVCSCPAERSRAHVLRKMRLSFCTHHALDTVLNLTMVANESPDECLTHLRAVQHLDDLASRVSCEFEHILSRYDCNNGYSSKWNCDDCKCTYLFFIHSFHTKIFLLCFCFHLLHTFAYRQSAGSRNQDGWLRIPGILAGGRSAQDLGLLSCEEGFNERWIEDLHTGGGNDRPNQHQGTE
uniref:Uncharacterized protein n=1 Tax=Strigamia maritima TaxID=126957 RepID=T1JHN8_STRMM